MNAATTYSPLMAKVQFGLSGHSNYSNFFLGKKARARREEKREDRKQEKADKRQEKQEKRELNNEKKRLKNEMRAAQIEEKRTQTNALNAQMQSINQLPPSGPSEGPPAASEKKDNTMTYVAVGFVGLLAVAGVGWAMFRKNNPGPVPYGAYAASYPSTTNPIKP